MVAKSKSFAYSSGICRIHVAPAMARPASSSRADLGPYECGVDFLCRTKPKESFNVLSLGDLETGDVVDVYAKCPAAKSAVLTRLVSTVATPQRFNGLEKRVLFVDLDFTVGILKLAELVESGVARAGGGDDAPESVVQQSLSRCHFVKCFSLVQLKATLDFLHELALKHDSSVLVVDGLSTLRWCARSADLYRDVCTAAAGCRVVTFVSRIGGDSAADPLRKCAEEVASVRWTVARDASGCEISSCRRGGGQERRTCRVAERDAAV